MKIPGKSRKKLMCSFLDTMSIISDKEYQRRIWIEAKGPEVDDFDEACIYFEDCDTILENWQDFELSEYQRTLLINFAKVFREFSDENDWPPDFIDEPEWTRITEMAKEVLRAFNYTKRDKL